MVLSFASPGLRSFSLIYQHSRERTSNERFVLALLCAATLATVSASQDITPLLGPMSGSDYRPRVLVTTDHGTCDYDDIQSLGHLFIYSDVIDLRGLVESHPRCGRDTKTSYVIDAYEKDYAKLITYSANYPSPAHLRSLVVQGRIGAQPPAGCSSPSDGSRMIISEAKKATTEDPLWVLVWGSTTDIAQALHDAPEIKKTIRVIFVSSWNRSMDPHSADYLDEHHKDLWYIEDVFTHRGLFQNRGARSATQEKGLDIYRVTAGPPHRSWADVHIKGHGALGDIIMATGPEVYLNFDGFKAGDTPSLLYVLHGDLNDPESPSWGGQFERPEPEKRPTFWTDREGGDPRSSVIRWREDIFADFARRMDRATNPKATE